MIDESWRRTLLPVTATLKQAIGCLDETGMQIVIVIDEAGCLVGTLTDGDIRRGLLRGLDLSSPIEQVVHREPMVVPPQWHQDTVLQLMQTNLIHQLPVVDAERRVVGLHLFGELLQPSRRDNLMVVMAGGKGTRLMPHTENCPKPLLPVGGKPMLEHILLRARDEGFNCFVFSLHYLGHMIEEYFGNGSRWQVQVDYLREDSPLGTAGALGLLAARPSKAFVVTNGDVLTDIRYGELLDFHARHQADATMAVRQYEWQHPFGVVHIDGVDIVGFEEKPTNRTHINAGVYVLSPTALDVVARGERCDMPTLFTRVLERGGRTIVYPMHEPWLDVGRPDDLERARGNASEPQS
jgi:dTDP-glucose pyrophosphorylase